MTYDLLAIVAITLLTQFLKQFVSPRWGDNGVHLVVAALAVIATAVQVAISHYPGFAVFASQVAAFLTITVGVYELILKKVAGSTPTDASIG